MRDRTHQLALLQALFVTILWSSSFVFIKIGLEEVPALSFAGIRYVLASIILWIFVFATKQHKELKNISKPMWIRLTILGIVMYFLTQGAQYLGLYYLSAIQVSLILNFTPLVILVFSSSVIQEKPTRNNIIGVIVFLIGIFVYVFPIGNLNGNWIGYVVMVIGLFTNSISTMLGRSINKEKSTSPILITTISMGIGGILLLGSGVALDGIPQLSLSMWGIILFLALVNTAFAFTLWNRTMQVLTSVESSIINNTMLIQIAILSWLFLNESFTLQSVISVVIVSIGVFLVQFKKKLPSFTKTK